uniref:AMP-dependent synthetase/ligase domain-containing protein n=1 Tax=Globisporangium ultimum (strain ATCC 200006 / CBS 805.95 / DAOM BR144) TaxID=431595 RepID=K3WMF8_GLOUD
MIYSSSHDELPIPQDQTLWSCLEQHARDADVANKPAFICALTAREVSFAQLLEQAKHIAAGLHANGIKKGDVVILHSINCIEYALVFFALNRLGAICSPSSPMFNAHELGVQIDLSQAKAVVTHKALAHVSLDAAKHCGIPEAQVYTMADAPAHEHELALPSIEELIVAARPFPALPPMDPKEVVFLPFSSGTTGLPKGVQITAKALMASAVIYSYIDRPPRYTLGLLPFFHIMATMVIHSCMYKAKAIVVLPRFQPETFLGTIQKYKLEKALVAPPVMLLLAQHPIVDEYDLSSLQELGCGGASLGVEIESMVEKRLNLTVVQGYGMTELAGAATFSQLGLKRPGSVGPLVPNVRMKVKCLTTGANLPPNERGELSFHVPSLMIGYLNNASATSEAFDDDGFLHTGDVGYVDDDGFVFIVDRIKEMIKYKGHQVAPAELEDVLNNHPSIADSCCVRGLDAATGEEVPKAYIVLRPEAAAGGAPFVAEDVIAYVATKVAPYKKVRQVEVIDAIPKSVSGKILRRQLQEQENAKIRNRGVATSSLAAHPA